MEKKRLNTRFVLLLILMSLQTVLFPLIQFTPGGVSSICSYISIVTVALTAALALSSGCGEKRDYLIGAGILFTLVADYFLVLKEKMLAGVIAFIFVQAAYFVYLLLGDCSRCVRIFNAVSRTVLSLVLVILAFCVLGEDTDPLAIASVIYYGNLVVNTVFAFALGKRERVFAIGLLLFCACDLCIGLEVLFTSYLSSDALGFFYGAYINLPWIFYQPSQILIALSLYFRLNTRSTRSKQEILDK